MADMGLIIKVNKKDYEALRVRSKFDDKSLNDYEKLIIHGVPLPEKYGKLADVSAVIDSLKGIERLHKDDELRSSILNALYANTLETEPEIDEEMEIEF